MAKDQSTIKLHLGVLPIATWSYEHLHLRISEMRDNEKILTVNTPKYVDRWSKLLFEVSPIATWCDKNLYQRNREMWIHDEIYIVESLRSWTVDLSSISELHRLQLGESRWFISRFTKCEIVKALGHSHGHIEEGASTEKLCIGVSEITTWRVETLGHRNAEMLKPNLKARLIKFIQRRR